MTFGLKFLDGFLDEGSKASSQQAARH